jgi:ribosomal protein S27AE
MTSSSAGCPKCGGLLMPNVYFRERYEDCMQCGFVRFLGGYFGVHRQGLADSEVERLDDGDKEESDPSLGELNTKRVRKCEGYHAVTRGRPKK